MTPVVSIIVPCFNEETTIQLLLEAIYKQTFPLNEIEVIIADGMSTDLTRQKIIAFRDQHPGLEIIIIDNPNRNIPSGLNCALKKVRGEYIIRLDGHSSPYPNYVSLILENLYEDKGNNVGGVWEIHPALGKTGSPTWISKSIAFAASNPIGVGDAYYRFAKSPKEVDTVPFGAFKKSLIDQVGYFDETLMTNEDYEFNLRIRKNGGKIWLDPAIRSKYFARPTFKALWLQYWRYGFWKARMLKRFPGSVRWRQALPPLFVLGLLGMLLLQIWSPRFLLLFIIVILIYIATLLGASLKDAYRQRDFSMLVGIPTAIAYMHLAWGTAFIWSNLIFFSIDRIEE